MPLPELIKVISKCLCGTVQSIRPKGDTLLFSTDTRCNAGVPRLLRDRVTYVMSLEARKLSLSLVLINKLIHSLIHSTSLLTVDTRNLSKDSAKSVKVQCLYVSTSMEGRCGRTV